MKLDLSQNASTVPVWPPLKTIADTKKEWVNKINSIIGVEITAGFEHEVNGVEYHFSYDRDDQTNFAQAIGSANLSTTLGVAQSISSLSSTDSSTEESITPVPTPDKWIQEWQGHKDGLSHTLSLNINQFYALAAAGAAHLSSKLSEGWQIKNEINSATTETEISNITTKYNLEIRYRDAYYALNEGLIPADVSNDTVNDIITSVNQPTESTPTTATTPTEEDTSSQV